MQSNREEVMVSSREYVSPACLTHVSLYLTHHFDRRRKPNAS